MCYNNNVYCLSESKMNKLLSPEKATEIKNIIEEIFEKYNHEESSSFDFLIKIIQGEGIDLVQSDLGDSSGILKRVNGKWKITVNQFDSPSRKLFTIAHELGHYFLHKDRSDTFVDGGYATFARDENEKYEYDEIEANEFAGQLLMPEKKITETIGERNVNEEILRELAQLFDVSVMAIGVRLKNLDYQFSF